jgi:hypothetical protein
MLTGTLESHTLRSWRQDPGRDPLLPEVAWDDDAVKVTPDKAILDFSAGGGQAALAAILLA